MSKTLHYIVYALTCFLIMVAFLVGCKKKPDEKYIHGHSSWKSYDPISIPYRNRMQYADKVNLVLNPSFEKGRIYALDSANITFSIDGWKTTGDHVYWVNTFNDSLYRPDEVSDSLHSIKICRFHANETDARGEGMVSDFIRVIPGNYDFSFDIKLKNIYSASLRLGTKVYDAIDIKILYFDKNKMQLDAKKYCPVTNNYYDASFKGAGFSNFWYIDSLSWSRVKGKSHNYHLFEGDIPDETWYVKLFFGLKGTGTMWLDNVYFAYSKKNFSLKERIGELNDSCMDKTIHIIPAPKIIRNKNLIRYFGKEVKLSKAPVIVIPKNAREETKYAASILLHHINKSFPSASGTENKAEIIIENKFQGLTNEQFVFSVGKTLLYEAFKNMLQHNTIKNKEEGYLIKSFTHKPKLIFLAGTHPIGDFYAATTLVQLLDTSKYQIHYAEIIDYPDFSSRGTSYSSISSKTGPVCNSVYTLLTYKYNRIYYNGIRLTNPANSREIATISKCMKKYPMMNWSAVVTPYSYTNNIPVANGKELTYQIRKALAMRANGILLYLDNTKQPPSQSIIPCHAVNRYDERLASDHTMLLKDVYGILPANHFQVDVVLPWHFNDEINMSCGYAEHYYDAIMPALKENINVLWGGNNGMNLIIDNADFTLYKNYTGKNPGILHHTNAETNLSDTYESIFQYYPGKIRIGNIFQLYEMQIQPDHFTCNPGSYCIIMDPGPAGFSTIRALVYSDFMWNTHNFDIAVSIWKALVKTYGYETAKEIIKFNNAYLGLTSICLKLENGEYNHKLIKHGEIWKQSIEFYYDKIKNLNPNKSLLQELHNLKNDIIPHFEKLVDTQNKAGDSL